MRIAFCTSLEPAEHAAWLAALRTLRPRDEWLESWPAGATLDAAVVAQPPRGALAGVRGLKLIQSLWAGVDRLLADGSLPAEVPLARMVDPSMTAAMAESAQWAVLSLHRHFFDYGAQQTRAVWQQRQQRRAEEVSVLVLGAGAMGLGVAQRLRALGYRVQAWRRGPGASHAPQEPVRLTGTERREGAGEGAGDGGGSEAQEIPLLCGDAALACALPQSQILINLLPLTPHTRGFLNARLFAAMPAGSALINFGRGAHLVEADLLDALERGPLQRAVLDVFNEEPLPREHAFWAHPRITVLPHVAALTDMNTASNVVAANLSRVQAGLPLLHLVDRTRGY